jgi:hypothetical protein
MVPPPHTSSGHQKIRGSGAGAKCGAPRFAPFGRTSPGTGFGGPQRGSQYLFMQLRDDAHPVDSGSEVQVQPCSRRRESRQATCSKVIDRITRSTTSPCLPALRKGDTQHSALRATLAAPLSHPQYQKNSDIGDQMIKKPLQQSPYPLSSFSPWTKTPSPSPL